MRRGLPGAAPSQVRQAPYHLRGLDAGVDSNSRAVQRRPAGQITMGGAGK